MTAGTKNTTTNSTKKSKRIFYPGKFYVATEDNYCIPFDTLDEAKEYSIDDTDTVLIALPKDKTTLLKKPVKADKIVLDFTTNTLTIQGEGVTINKVDYDKDSCNILDDEELKEYDKIIDDCCKNSNDFEIIGIPPVDGEVL